MVERVDALRSRPPGSCRRSARSPARPRPCRAARTCPGTSTSCRRAAAGTAAGPGRRPSSPGAASPPNPCRSNRASPACRPRRPSRAGCGCSRPRAGRDASVGARLNWSPLQVSARALARASRPSNGQAFSLTFVLPFAFCASFVPGLPSIASTSGCSPATVFLPALNRGLVDRLADLGDARGLHRSVGLVEVYAFLVPRAGRGTRSGASLPSRCQRPRLRRRRVVMKPSGSTFSQCSISSRYLP